MSGDSIKELSVPSELGVIADLAPVDGQDRPVWLVLGEDGQISRWDLETGEHTPVGITTVPLEPDHDPWDGHELRRHLHASSDGSFAAVVNDFGRCGEVLDLRTGELTLTLDNESDDLETVPFSLAFARHRGRDVVIHRADWNRLDVSDPATGRLLTDRASPVQTETEHSPEHYLDYFHGALRVSPDGRQVVDDGWVWQPAGFPTVWSLERWIEDNVWESEDGPTRIELCDRGYYWNRSVVWIDSVRVALEGLGDDDANNMLPGARIFDTSRRTQLPGWKAETALELPAVDGPAGRFFSDGVSLFSSAETGLSKWDLEKGSLIEEWEGFSPTHHHRGAGQFLQLADGLVRLWP
ncbi:hypothetical protein OHA70_29495 [Kribbella sp. NBC_00382]|uniref:hypothetical protein n=1 Tax=Kribbella sp. NBC_00382 TaxID=2975967 RepID=UPI002E247C0F